MSRPKGSKNKLKIREVLEKFIEANSSVEHPDEKLFFASLHVMGKTYTAEGATVKQAIQNLKPEIAKGHGVLALSHGRATLAHGRYREKILSNTQVMRLFGKGSAMAKEIALKQTCLLFEGAF